MHRGTIRPRSPSDSESGDIERPRLRQKQSAATSHTSTSHHTSSKLATRIRSDMGHEMNNGAGSTNGSQAGPSTSSATNGNGDGNGNGHSSLPPPLLLPVSLPGKLMYQDDEDWATYQDFEDGEVDDQDGMEVEGTGPKRRRRGIAAAKRMPIEREEVVRLILQGLRDIGYE